MKNKEVTIVTGLCSRYNQSLVRSLASFPLVFSFAVWREVSLVSDARSLVSEVQVLVSDALILVSAARIVSFWRTGI